MRDWTNVGDVACALDQAAALASDQAPVLNLATGQATSVREIASIVALHWGDEDAKTRVSFNGQSRTGDPFSLVANTARMRSQGIECPIPVTQGIAEYVDWFRARANSA